MYPLNLIRFAPAEGKHVGSPFLLLLAQNDALWVSALMGRITGIPVLVIIALWVLTKLGVFAKRK